jgi:uncharacterized iron-regulated protein
MRVLEAPHTAVSLALTALLSATVLPSPALAAVEVGDEPDMLHLTIGAPDRRDRAVDLVVDGVTDTASGEVLSPARVAERLAATRLVFFGELHTSMEVHRAQLRLLEELESTGRPLLIGLEMFPYTAQEGLDRWVGGLLTEEGFLEIGGWYEHWGLHWGYYRDIFLFARDRGVPMIGVNTPREVVSAVRKKGLDELSEEERAQVPPSMNLDGPETEDHRTLFRRLLFGDADDDETIHSSMSDEQLEAMRSAQVTWDATMAYNAVRALDDAPEDAILVVLIGSGHVAYGLGSERQARQWFDGEIASVIPVPAQDEDQEPVETVQASYADFVWGLPGGEELRYPSLGSSTTRAGGSEEDGPTGRRVIFVPEDTVAERAGLRVGDVITAIDGRAVPDKVAYNRVLSGYRWGDEATFTVVRDGEAVELEVIFRRLPEEENDAED